MFQGEIPPQARLIHVEVSVHIPPSANTISDDSIVDLHRRLGHPNFRYLKSMLAKGSVEGLEKVGLIPLDLEMHCNTCDLAKSHRIPHNFPHLRSTHVLENIHLDLSGIICTPSLCGAYYYILFTDDYTRYRYISFLRSKSAEDVHLKVSQFIALVERQQGRQVKKITLDNGSEFINDTMSPACEKLGIYLRTTASYTPEENGVAE